MLYRDLYWCGRCLWFNWTEMCLYSQISPMPTLRRTCLLKVGHFGFNFGFFLPFYRWRWWFVVTSISILSILGMIVEGLLHLTIASRGHRRTKRL